jgi:hypothetical protein
MRPETTYQTAIRSEYADAITTREHINIVPGVQRHPSYFVKRLTVVSVTRDP